MSKGISNRIKRLERKSGIHNGIKKYFDAISGTSCGLPSDMPPVSPEKQAEIKSAFAQLSEEELAMFSDLLVD